mmetsp:Transcript_32330/g.81372  ORF Transcript_32330/g.81372 Transcript_32330/m.81372 type:complete len:109 (+) Transcript_32330:2432-2758(+)
MGWWGNTIERNEVLCYHHRFGSSPSFSVKRFELFTKRLRRFSKRLEHFLKRLQHFSKRLPRFLKLLLSAWSRLWCVGCDTCEARRGAAWCGKEESRSFQTFTHVAQIG